MKYIKSFKIFESSISFPTSKEEIDKICLKYNIRNYTINEDFSIDVNGVVDLYNKRLTKLPLKFNKSTDYFDCSSNNLTSLEGCPKQVIGVFDCSSNNLKNLEGCPEVDGDFYCYGNQLVNLFPLTKEPDSYYNNPCSVLYKICLRDLEIEFEELNFRLEEFNCFKNNKLDLISLENLYEFYGKKFNENKFK